jgi:hypothetical protein
MPIPPAAITRLGLAVALCGAMAHGAPPDPCSLLTTAQINAVLKGLTVGPGRHLGANVCVWVEPGQSVANGKGVLLRVLGQVGSMTPVQQFHNIKTPVPGFFPPAYATVKTPVRGLGDDAVFERVGYGVPELSVRKGGNVFQVSIHGMAANQIGKVEAEEKALAQQVVARLP